MGTFAWMRKDYLFAIPVASNEEVCDRLHRQTSPMLSDSIRKLNIRNQPDQVSERELLGASRSIVISHVTLTSREKVDHALQISRFPAVATGLPYSFSRIRKLP